MLFFKFLSRLRVKPLIIPDYDPYEPCLYPGDIKPGYYNATEVKQVWKKHRNNAAARKFIRDMQEE